MSTKEDPKSVLKRLTSSDTPPARLLIIGVDQVRKERSLDLLLKTFFSDQNQSIGIQKHNCSERSLKKLESIFFDTLAPSLFSDTSGVVFRGIDDFKADLGEAFRERMKSAPADTVIWCTASKLQKRSLMYKYFSKEGEIIEFDEMSEKDLLGFVARELKRNGVANYNRSLLEVINSTSGGRPDLLVSMIEHLALYIEEDTATVEDFQLLFPDVFDPREYELTDAILRGNQTKAELLVSALLDGGKSPFLLLSMLGNNLSQKLLVAVLRNSGLHDDQIASRLKIPAWLYKKRFPFERSSVKTHQSSLQAALKADSRLKNKSLGPELIMSEMISETAKGR